MAIELADNFHCGECGQLVGDGVVFHPYLYCVLYKAGISKQAQFLADSGFRRVVRKKAPPVTSRNRSKARR